MLTGVYPHQHGLTENDGRFGGRDGLSPSDWILNKPLLDAGYRCAWFGKWHVDNRLCANDYGFEGFSLPGYGYPYSTSEYKNYLERNHLPAPQVSVELLGESGVAVGTRVNLTEQREWFDYEAGAAVLSTPAETHESYFVASLAADWIKSLGDEPFFLRVDTWGPHPPYTVAEPFLNSISEHDSILTDNYHYSLEQRPRHHRDYRDYWQSTLGIDENDWRQMATRSIEHAALVESALLTVVETIERLGLTDQTMIIFTADHGDAVGSNGGVANKGGLMVEETMRVPLLISGPGVPGDEINRSLVTNLDLPVTVLEACNIESNVAFHGKSLVPVFKDSGMVIRDGLMTQHYGLHQRVVQRAYYAGEYKYVIQDDGFEELYNLVSDPCEMSNLANSSGLEAELSSCRIGLRNEMHATNDTSNPIFELL